MQISLKAWMRYKDKLASVNQKAADEMEKYIQQIGGYGEHSDEVIRYAYALSNKYGEAAAAAACEMYDEVAKASGVFAPSAEPAPMPEFGEVARAVGGTVKNSSESRIPGTVGRLVKRAGADTTLKNAQRDGAEFAWIPAGDTCAFCLMLASNGWQHVSKDTLKNGHADHIHPNCDCTYAVRFDSKSNVAGYNPDKYKQMFEEAEGDTYKEKVNSIRRMRYQDPKIRNRINAQKRAAYAERQQQMIVRQTEGEATIPKSMIGDFSDYAPLELSQREQEILEELHRNSIENRFEYGKIYYNEGETDLLSNQLYDKVALPVEQTEGTDLHVFHSHTNDTPPSSADFKPLAVEKVDRIGVISNNGDTWVVEIGDGYRPTKDELEEALKRIKEEVVGDLENFPGYDEWTPEERNYMLIREKFFRVTREFGWKAMGGNISDVK